VARTASAVPEPVTDDGVDSTTEHDLLAGQVLAYRLDGPLFFAVADRFLREITATTDVRVVILRLGAVAMLDATGARVLGEIVEHLRRQGIMVLVKTASDEHRRLLTAVGTLAPLVARGHVFSTFPEAVAHAAEHVAATGLPHARVV
jgi:SulP family sulfate permease